MANPPATVSVSSPSSAEEGAQEEEVRLQATPFGKVARCSTSLRVVGAWKLAFVDRRLSRLFNTLPGSRKHKEPRTPVYGCSELRFPCAP